MATPVFNTVALPAVDPGNGTVTDEFLNGLVQDSAWDFGGGPHVLTYSFDLNDTAGIQPAWTAALKTAFTQALAAWSNVANISFQQVASNGVFLNSSADVAAVLTRNELMSHGAAGVGFFPDPALIESIYPPEYNRANYPGPEGDVAFDIAYSGFQYLTPGGDGLSIMVHEIGHALGLKHPHDNGGGDDPSFAQLGISSYDADRWTTMSYNDYFGENLFHSSTPMPLDVLAIQQIYGANLSYHAGNDLYTPIQGLATIWDAGGSDTIAGYSFYQHDNDNGIIIDLTPGFGRMEIEPDSFAHSVNAIAFNVDIENAIGGGGSDTITGNALANILDGRERTDFIDGADGNDTLLGGSTNADTLAGGAGNDLLDGGAGFDSLAGGLGDDTYIVQVTAPGAGAVPGAGVPFTSAVMTLSGPPSIQTPGGSVLLDSSRRGDFSVGFGDWTRDGLVDELTFNFYDDTSSTVGYYTLSFSTQYIGQNLLPGTYTDAAFLDLHAPTLQVQGNHSAAHIVAGTFTITAADFHWGGWGGTSSIENFSVTFQTATGSSPGPVFTGSLVIGTQVAATSDVADPVVELADQGTDTVLSSRSSYTLGANVENLTLTGTSGIAGYGNEGANVLTGNAGANTLAGAGGDDTIAGRTGADAVSGNGGADSIEGHLGFDTLSGNQGDDQVRGGQGEDFLYGDMGADALSGELGADRLFGGPGGDWLDGGGGNDSLQGNLGNDTLIGGPGNDTLDGGTGFDTFLYAALSPRTGDVAAGGGDTLFATAGDTIDLFGLLDNLVVNGTLLSVSGNVTLGSAVNASNDLAYSGGVLRIDITNDNTFNAANDFQMTITGGINSVSFDPTDGLLHLL